MQPVQQMVHILHPRPRQRHLQAAVRQFIINLLQVQPVLRRQRVQDLEGFVRPRGLGTVYTGDTGFILARSPDTVRGPDIAFVSSGRREILEDEDRFLPGPPDLAVEVLSPGDRAGRIREKVADYLTAGTRMVWVVDPARGRVNVYRALLSPRTLQPGDEVEGEDVLPGFRAEVSEFL